MQRLLFFGPLHFFFQTSDVSINWPVPSFASCCFCYRLLNPYSWSCVPRPLPDSNPPPLSSRCRLPLASRPMTVDTCTVHTHHDTQNTTHAKRAAHHLVATHKIIASCVAL